MRHNNLCKLALTSFCRSKSPVACINYSHIRKLVQETDYWPGKWICFRVILLFLSICLCEKPGTSSTRSPAVPGMTASCQCISHSPSKIALPTFIKLARWTFLSVGTFELEATVKTLRLIFTFVTLKWPIQGHPQPILWRILKVRYRHSNSVSLKP